MKVIFDPKKLEKELERLDLKTKSNNFWDDAKSAMTINKKISQISNSLDNFNSIKEKYNESLQIIDILNNEDDEELYNELNKNIEQLLFECESFEIKLKLTGDYDSNNAILSIHSGAGGTEAQDWAEMLYRMYVRYAETRKYKIENMDIMYGDSAGIKSVTFAVRGENAYGYLKGEKGVHRLVRISPFDSNSKRHTSFASLSVMPEIDSDDEIEISTDEIRVDTYRASGAGGQHVNTTDSAVRITHIPTNIVVQCQSERSQIQNRQTAMSLLRSKLAELKERQHAEKLSDIKGEDLKIEWGSQIRSYVFHPYSMVKDHRTNYSTSNTEDVMNGNLDRFINEYLKSKGK